MEQVISQPTRVTLQSSTIIDHFYTNNLELYNRRGVIDPAISDHALIFACRKRATVNKEKVFRLIRNYRDFDPLLFCHDLTLTDWTAVYNAPDVNTATEIFQEVFLEVVNRHMPWKRVRVRWNSAPWVTSEFLSMIDRRRYHQKLFNKCPCAFHQNLKKTTERECHRMKIALKRSYVERSLERHKTDPYIHDTYFIHDKMCKNRDF